MRNKEVNKNGENRCGSTHTHTHKYLYQQLKLLIYIDENNLVKERNKGKKMLT